MNKTILAFGTLAIFGLAQPASAMMCAPGQQARPAAAQTQAAPAQSTAPTQGGMMCGAGQAAADDPFGEQSAQQRQRGGMCPCCRNMAGMMRGGMGGMMGGSGSSGGMQHHNMPGMEAPKQQ
jgi:hypothetical protein